MAHIINLAKEKYNVSERIYGLLADQPSDKLAMSILAVLEEFSSEKEIVELPCKVGDTLYEITKRYSSHQVSYKIVARTVESIVIGSATTIINCYRKSFFTETDFGRTVFLTEEKAQKRLKKIYESEE